MNATKILGTTALFAGFLAGTYVVVAQATAINWQHYSACGGLMLAGLIATSIARKGEGTDHEKHEQDVGILKASLEQLTAHVRSYIGIERDEDLLELHKRIDAELSEEFGKFVDARESMIPRFGINTYTEVMSAFATGERLINRCWSASADGYVDEVRLCLGTALAELESADRLLEAAHA
ncbi:MAG: hypothetical protein ACI8QZ_001203 [Chlamydiales bacterium]|jgi:hypothetical protein